jgi:hypothetical protein
MRSTHRSIVGTSWIPRVQSDRRRQDRDDTSELLLTELRRGMALVGGTFNNEQSRARASFEAARIRDVVRELIADSFLDGSQRARIERGLEVLSANIVRVGGASDQGGSQLQAQSADTPVMRY